jgi:uncharacterized protein involved in exopolysaccharide biosynthesis
MAREETLFHPIPQQKKAAASPGGGGPALRMEVDPDEERESLLETLTFAARAARRRKPLTVGVLVVGMVLTLVAEYLAPRQYEVEARVLVLRSQLAAALVGNNQNSIMPDEKRDAKEYEEQIRSRANIESIVTDCKLVERWDQNLSPLRRLVDHIGPKLGRPIPTQEAKLNTLAAVLEKALKVNIDTSTVIISVDWPDPVLAHDIIHAAVEKFTKARYATEVGVIPESISILERYADEARADMERASANLNDVHRGAAPAQPTASAKDTKDSHDSDKDKGKSAVDPAERARLNEIQAQLRAITDERDRRLQELNAQLTEMSATYAPAHPAVVALKATIEQTRQDSPALASLKSEEASLQAKVGSAGGGDSRRASRGKGSAATAAQPEERTAEQRGEVQDRFESALRRVEALRNRIDEAKIEERTADANFNHRYQVVHPAEYPLGPKSPVTLLVGVGGALLTLLMILAAAAIADLLSGVFYEPRRVRDALKLPVLGEANA